MMMSILKNQLFLSLVCLLCFQNFARSARILCIYTVPFDSHNSVFQVITEELAQRGHELVVFTPLPHSTPVQNVTEIDLHIGYKVWDDMYAAAQKNHSTFSTDLVTLYGEVFIPMIRKLVEIELTTPVMQSLIQDKEQQFDVILMEACVVTNLVFAARFSAPVILVSSFYGSEHNFLTMGAAVHPLLFPDINLQNYAHDSIWDKFSALYKYVMFRYYEHQQEVIGDAMIKKHFGEKAPKFHELKKNIQMMFLNVHHIWDNNRPVPPSVIYMGAIHMKKPETIPQHLQTYLNSSQNGVIYISLGSKVRFSDLPPQTLKVFLNVFASIPYDVLIKWNGGEFPDKPANVRLEKWLPQNDMLHHPKIKAFITQGGLQSTDEAIAAKVPLLALPVFGDQFFNAHKYVQHGIGVTLNINTLEEEQLREAILKIVEDRSYRTNIARLSRIMEEQRAGGLDKAMYWVEYVATHGAEHLGSPLANASIRDYLLLDYLGLVAFVIMACVLLICVVLRVFIACIVTFVMSVTNVAIKEYGRKYKVN